MSKNRSQTMTDREKVEKIVEVVFGKQVAEYDPKFNTKNFQPLLPENIYQCFLLTKSKWFKERFGNWTLQGRFYCNSYSFNFYVYDTQTDRCIEMGQGSTPQEAILNCFMKMPEIREKIKGGENERN